MITVDKPRLIYAVETYETQGQCGGDCDACAPIITSNLKDNSIDVSLQTSPTIQLLYLTPQYELRHGIHHRPVVVNQAAKRLLATFSSPRPLTTSDQEQAPVSILNQMVSLGILVPKDKEKPFLEIHNVLTAWLHITNNCNLACHYCFLHKNNVYMSLEVGYTAINTTFAAALVHGYQVVKLKYAGGEPLLRFEFITQLHKHAQELASQQGIKLDGVVLSNGTLLTPQILEAMQSLGLRLMISLDGLGEAHDCQRSYANGRSSSEDVIKSIELALAYDLIPDISITISGRNVENLPELVVWLLERDLPFSFNFYRKNEHSASYKDLQLEEEKIICGMLATYKVIEANLPKRSLLPSIVDRANLAIPHLRPCSVGQSYMVFDTSGNISKCQMQIGNPITNIQAQDPLTLLRRDKNTVQNLSVEEKEECQTCDWRYWCAGGCPLATYRATGRYNTKSPNCAIYKALFPEVVRLEGLRLLKYAQNI